MNAHKIVLLSLAICIAVGGAAVVGNMIGQRFESLTAAFVFGLVMALPVKLFSNHIRRQAVAEDFFRPDSWIEARLAYRMLSAFVYAALAWFIFVNAGAGPDGLPNYYFAFMSGALLAIAGISLLPGGSTENGPINE